MMPSHDSFYDVFSKGKKVKIHWPNGARLAVSLAPGSPEPRFNLAKALERLGRREEAIAEYRRLPAFEPARASLRALSGS